MHKRAQSAGVLMAGVLLSSVLTAQEQHDQSGQAYTQDHRFLVKILSAPKPLPYEKYFTVKVEVDAAGHPDQPVPDVQVKVTAGMAHGMQTGFAHTMESTPKVDVHGGIATISGMYFTMEGSWTLEVTVREKGEESSAYIPLECCGQ